MDAPRIVTLANGAFAENCYLVADAAAREAAIVDPGEETDRFLARLEREQWTLTAIWLTHAHVDHVAGVAAMHAATQAPVWLHPADRPLYDRAADQARVFGLSFDPPPPPERAFAEGQTVHVGAHRFGVLHTPGHSPGHVCLAGDGCAFVGDAGNRRLVKVRYTYAAERICQLKAP